MTSSRLKTVALSICTVALLTLASTAAAAGEADKTETTTPIKHFVVLMQENHTFDNYFGTYPGADGVPEGNLHAPQPEEAEGRLR